MNDSEAIHVRTCHAVEEGWERLHRGEMTKRALWFQSTGPENPWWMTVPGRASMLPLLSTKQLQKMRSSLSAWQRSGSGGGDEEAVLYKKELLLTSNGPMSSQPTPMCFNPLCARWEPKEGGRREGSPKPVPLKKEPKPLPRSGDDFSPPAHCFP